MFFVSFFVKILYSENSFDFSSCKVVENLQFECHIQFYKFSTFSCLL